jgi:hypothetical protein
MIGSMAESPGIDTTVPHPARVYDCWLGGENNHVDKDPIVRLHAQALLASSAEGATGVQISQWRAESDLDARAAAALWGGVAAKRR